MTNDEWRESVLQRLSSLELNYNKLDTKMQIDEVQRNSIEKRLEGIEDALKWLVRLVLSALILAIIGFLVSGGFYVS